MELLTIFLNKYFDYLIIIIIIYKKINLKII